MACERRSEAAETELIRVRSVKISGPSRFHEQGRQIAVLLDQRLGARPELPIAAATRT
jgi:hypothetical protein